MKLKPLRLVIPVAVLVVLAGIGVFIWPGFLNISATSSTIGGSQGETAQDEGVVLAAKDQFNRVIREDAAFYNCAANDEVRESTYPNVKSLIPCGTDIVEITSIGGTSEDVPQIMWRAGDGNDNVVTVTQGMVNSWPMWTVIWSVGQGSTFLQQYIQYRCADGRLYWTPVAQHAASASTGEFSYVLTEDIVGIGLVFTDGKSGTMVPYTWWSSNNRWVR